MKTKQDESRRMNAVVLVAGVARRLAPLTDTTHKALLPVGGRPLLARMLDALAAAGIRRTVLVVGHCADQIRRLAGERRGSMARRLRRQSRVRARLRPVAVRGAELPDRARPHHGRRRPLPARAAAPPARRPRAQRAPRRPRLLRHRRGGQDLHARRPCDRARQEGGAGGVGRRRRGRRLLQVRRRGGPAPRALPAQGHRREPRHERVRGRAPHAGGEPPRGLGGRHGCCPGPRSISSKTCAVPRPTCFRT